MTTIQRMLSQKLFLYTTPYIAYTLIIYGFFLAIHSPHFFSLKGGLSAGVFLCAFVLLGAYFYICITLPEKMKRREAQFSLIFSAFIYTGLLFLTETLLPPLDCNYTKTQKNIQRQIERRNKHKEINFRDITMRFHFNNLGWPGKEWNYTSKEGKIVFIGDSFLEVRSSKNISEIVEENLKQQENKTEIVTLSIAGTGPEHYRYFFNEFAFDIKPKHIFIFLYEANDFSMDFMFKLYKHPDFTITQQAYEMMETLSLPLYTQKSLFTLMKDKKIYHSKNDLLNDLNRFNLDINQKNLIYLISYGYSCNAKGMPLFPRLFDVLDKELTVQEQSKAAPLPTWENIFPQYKKIFAFKLIEESLRKLKDDDLPENIIKQLKSMGNQTFEDKKMFLETIEKKIGKEQSVKYGLAIQKSANKNFIYSENERLEKIAQLLAYDYLKLDNYRPCLELLRKQDDFFISYLIDELDMIYYLVVAVQQSIKRTIPEKGWPVAAEVTEKTVQEYLKLIEEMKTIAQSRGIELTFVFIPEASYSDEDFRQFWKPMLDFQKQFTLQHALYMSLKSKLLGKVSFIDLGDFSDKLYKGYWKFDGHWNEKGNRNVGKIIASFIINQNKELHSLFFGEE